MGWPLIYGEIGLFSLRALAHQFIFDLEVFKASITVHVLFPTGLWDAQCSRWPQASLPGLNALPRY